MCSKGLTQHGSDFPAVVKLLCINAFSVRSQFDFSGTMCTMELKIMQFDDWYNTIAKRIVPITSLTTEQYGTDVFSRFGSVMTEGQSFILYSVFD